MGLCPRPRNLALWFSREQYHRRDDSLSNGNGAVFNYIFNILARRMNGNQFVVLFGAYESIGIAIITFLWKYGNSIPLVCLQEADHVEETIPDPRDKTGGK